MASIGKKDTLHQRMVALRAAAGHRDLRPSERSLLVILLTYQSFKEDPTFRTGWRVTRKRLAEDYYGRADKTSLRNLDHLLGSLLDKGFIEAFGDLRSANTYAVNFHRLSVRVTGPTHRPPAGQKDRREPVVSTDRGCSDGPTISTHSSSRSAETTSLPESDPGRPGEEERAITHALPVSPEVMELAEMFGVNDLDDADSFVPALKDLLELVEMLVASKDLNRATVQIDLYRLARSFHGDPARALAPLARLYA